MGLKKLLTIFAISVCSLGAMAQHKTTQKADEAFEKGYWAAAIENYKIAIKKEKNKDQQVRIMYNLAQSFENARDYKNAINWYKKVISKGKTFTTDHPEVYLHIADAHKKMEDYQNAQENYDIYAEKNPEDERGKNGSKSCKLAIEWTTNPTRYKVENMRQLNSKNDDAIPAYAAKRYNELVFQSYRPGATGKGENDINGQAFPDLYHVKVDKSGKWSKPALLNETVNTDFAEGSPSFNKKMNTIYFTRCENHKKEDKACQIYYAKKKGQAYGDALQIPVAGDSIVVAHPALSPDDKVLYFVARDMEGGYGGADIWYATWDSKKKEWTNVTNAGPTINTAGDELYPFVHADGTLYFSSNGHVGIGGFDIFKAESTKDGWAPVQNMKVPINSSADDIAIIFEGESERGYLTSNRAGGRGGMDIWSFNLPKLELFVQGIVKDQQTKEILPNSKVVMTGSDGSTLEAVTDETGSYKFELQPNTHYQLQASNDATQKNQFGKEINKYFASEKALISTIGVEESKTFVQDLELERIPLKGIELPNILYAYNSADLLDESKLQLNGLVETMKANPTLVIELGSHTDFRGSDVYNRKLAQRRAQSAVDYLISQGIEKGRMEAKGYGEDEPKTIDSTVFSKFDAAYVKGWSGVAKSGNKVKVTLDEIKKNFPIGTVLNEAFINGLGSEALIEFAHQMNRRTEFKVLRTDYKPGQTAQGEAPADKAGQE